MDSSFLQRSDRKAEKSLGKAIEQNPDTWQSIEEPGKNLQE